MCRVSDLVVSVMLCQHVGSVFCTPSQFHKPFVIKLFAVLTFETTFNKFSLPFAYMIVYKLF